MTWIYFMLIDGERIKIGESGDVTKRIRDYEKGQVATHEVRLLVKIEGTGACERHVQRYFADDSIVEHRQRNGQPAEMFWPSMRLTSYIRWLRNNPFACLGAGEASIRVMQWPEWEPLEHRQAVPPSLPLMPDDPLEFPEPEITSDDYYTCEMVIECARKTLGRIDLDPASCRAANKTVKADRFFSQADSGLDHEWSGRVWLNPPFSDWRLWVEKLLTEHASGRIEAMCILSAMRTTSTQYFRPLLDMIDGLCIITGRKAFGGLGKQPDDGHCIMYIGNSVESFITQFQEIGVVLLPENTRQQND